MKNSWKDIRVKLTKCSERDLIGMIGDLYKLNSANKNYLDAKFFNDEVTLKKYKQQITKSLTFEPYEGGRAKLSVARKAISDYKKANGNVLGLLELMTHYLERGALITAACGYYENGFYESMHSMCKSALTVMKENPGQSEVYLRRIKSVGKKCSDYGWEFEKMISDMEI